ncbi:TauD/TfdA dioxygenase family protein [Aquibaculum arenosum]|uniref:TauD/TfdA family dioxygenase n=1 Tax=Aquibaculum arenosum TaxID=3032591 RepID=A0ABT5YKX7_9PROT|nr:TauD/TfdA family dioxygenase [Fodinicurvata sp. CAU 1616]MDF2094914.1 TauD/TfdA family dioxygenase [Fodinicurvata sp. CAU 1616]
MSISIYPVTEDFAAEIGDVDLSQPLAPEVVEEIKQAFWQYAVLIFPAQELTHEQHLDFARHIGPLETAIPVYSSEKKLRLGMEFSDVSNLNGEDEVWEKNSRMRMFQLGNRLWHTDSSFRHVPARASLLYGREVAPIGGHTQFADERAAYDALPQATKQRIDDLIAEHSIMNSRAKLGFTNFSEEEKAGMPTVRQVLVRTIPESGRKSLYLASHIGGIVGLPESESKALLEELMDHATQRQFVYTHRWRQNDLVMWDNRCTMHRGTEFDDLRWRRDMQRATVSDTANSCELNSARMVEA